MKNNAFGREFRKILVDKDMNLSSFAEKYCYSKSYLTFVCNGTRKITGSLLCNVLKYLGKENAEVLKKAAVISMSEYTINVSKMSEDDREKVFAILESIKDGSLNALTEVLESNNYKVNYLKVKI